MGPCLCRYLVATDIGNQFAKLDLSQHCHAAEAYCPHWRKPNCIRQHAIDL